MKYKVGNKVKVREDLEIDEFYGNERFAESMNTLKGKRVTITKITKITKIGTDVYTIKEDCEMNYWTDEMFEGLAEYTYEDLCKAPVGTKITFENRKIFVKSDEACKDYHVWGAIGSSRNNKDLENLKDNYGDYGKIIKIEKPSYTTVYEVKKEILDEKEKEYLSNVIKPFKDKVQSIVKHEAGDKYEYISFHSVKLADGFTLPLFQKDAMYRGMEVGREYSLEELGLN